MVKFTDQYRKMLQKFAREMLNFAASNRTRMMNESLQSRQTIFSVSDGGFAEAALSVFQYQYENNRLYHDYCNLLKRDPAHVTSIEKIPFLPIQFFKTSVVKTGIFKEAIIFESSGTTGSINSRHFVNELAMYEQSFLQCFEQFYGDPKKLCIIGLLPSYLERKNSSLVYMVDKLIKISGVTGSGFYLYEHSDLKKVLEQNEKQQQQTLLIGVTYALLDFAGTNQMRLEYTTVMETGGMKGRRREISRNAVHEMLMDKLGLMSVHSEYGMTELLSQAYSTGKGIFNSPPWMKILVRKEDDPFDITSTPENGKEFAGGAINIIDLANLHSCAFIATDDAGKLYKDGSFEVTGRLDNSDIRGCGLMIM